MQSQHLPHLLGQLAQPDGRVVVDGEAQVVGVVEGEQALVGLAGLLELELLRHVLQPHVLGYVLEDDLEEHPGSGSGGLGTHADGLEDGPVDGLPAEQVAVEVPQVPDLVGLLVEDVVVVAQEGLLEEGLELLVDAAEPLGQQAEEGLVDALHHAALEDHVDQFVLVALGEVGLEHLVGALLEVERRLQGQVDGLAQVHQVLLGQVLDALLGLGLVVGVGHVVGLLQPRDVVLPQDLLLGVVPLLLGLHVVGVEPEQVALLLPLQLVVQVQLVSDLVLQLDQVQLGYHPRLLLEARLAHGKEVFYAVLGLLADLRLVEEALEGVEDGRGSGRGDLAEHLSHLDHEVAGDLHRVLRGLVEQDHQDLEGHVLAQHPLVNEVGDHARGGHADQLVVALEAALELDEHPLGHQQPYLGHLGVDHRDEGGVDVGEVGGGHLGLDQGAGEQPLAPEDVLVEELHYHVLDVGDVDLVDYSVDRLPQQLPHHALVRLSGRVRLQQLFLHGSQLVGRNVDAPRFPHPPLLVVGLGLAVVLLHEEIGLVAESGDQ